MIYRAYGIAVFIKPFAVLGCDLEILFDDSHRRDASETNDDLGADRLYLLAEIIDAKIFFLGLGVAVVRGAAFENIGNVDLVSVNAYRVEIFIEKLASRADEGNAGLIFLLSGCLADEHESGCRLSHAENDVGACLAQLAFFTGFTSFFYFFECFDFHENVPSFGFWRTKTPFMIIISRMTFRFNYIFEFAWFLCGFF